MGEVWRARDLHVGADCALKIMLDNANPTALDLFNREQAVLADLQSPHIVPIYDRGFVEGDDGKQPFFVMPLLRGKTLAELIKGNRITPEWLADVLRQVCRGLQAAHVRKIYHRDLKPSNIIVDDDDSATIIDFGVAHLGDSQNSGFLGTPQYTAPELLDIYAHHEPSAATDVFSLAVVAYEALTRQRPFERSSDRETIHALLTQFPAPIWKLNRDVSISLGKVIHKGMAKIPLHRYSSAKEFADKLQKALQEEAPLVDKNLAARFERAQKAFVVKDFQTADGMLTELEAEGEADECLYGLREQLNSAIRERTLYQQLETARALVVQEDPMAVPKLQEILVTDPENPEALRLLAEVRGRKTEKDIENWLTLARRHLEADDFPHAREALQEILTVRRDTRAFELLADLDRREKEVQAICLAKEKLFEEAERAYGKGELSTALSKLGKLLGLIDPKRSSLDERDVRYQDFYKKVHSEHEETNRAYAQAHKYLADNVFDKALDICAQFPKNPVFQALKLEAEERQRHERSAYLAEVSLRVDREPDLDKRVAILEEAVRLRRDDPQFKDRLRIATEKRNLIASIVAQARDYEKNRAYNEALGQWEAIRRIHSQYPGLSYEIDRLSKQRDREAAAEARSQLEEQIDNCLQAQDFERAVSLCKSGLAEFPNDGRLEERRLRASEGLELTRKAEEALEQAVRLIEQNHIEEGLASLRAARALPVGSSLVKVVLVDTLSRYASALVNDNPELAGQLVAEALALNPNHALCLSVKATIEESHRVEFVEQSVAKLEQMERDGDWMGATLLLGDGLGRYPGEAKLTQIQERVTSRLAIDERPKAVAELQRLLANAQSEHDPDKIDALLNEARRWADKYAADEEISRLVGRIEERRQAVASRAESGSTDSVSFRKWATAAVVMVAVCVAIAFIAMTLLRPVKAERAVGTAVVQTARTDLIEHPDARSKPLMALLQGTRVNVLGWVGRDQSFVRVQFVSPKKNSRPGYVRREDLEQWSDPGVAWDLLALRRPPDSAAEADWRKFAEQLRRFGLLYPATGQADESGIECSRIYLSIAGNSQKAGKPRSEWESDLTEAKKALDAVRGNSSASADLLRKQFAELETPEPPQPPAPPSPKNPELQRLVRKAYQAYNAADDEELLRLADQIQSIDPAQADALRRLVKDAREALTK